MYILNVRKKVLGVIILFEVATHQPPILFLLVDGLLFVFCTSLDRYGSQLQGDVLAAVKKGIGFIVELVERWCVAMGLTQHCC